MQDCLNIALLEPYYGGSHAVFVDTLAKHSRHRIVPVTLPARKWKWRMRGAAMWFTREDRKWLAGGEDGPIDAILANDMLSVADLRSLLPQGARNLPIACYFHENQLTYPLPRDQQRDYQYGMTNISSCLASDSVWFNSRFHLEEFLQAAADLLRKMPDFVPGCVVDEIRARAEVLPPPVAEPSVQSGATRTKGPPTILWCHRWEYDKNPEPFFDALLALDAEGCDFRLVMVGEQFREAPPAFEDAMRRLHRRIVHAGFVADRDQYWSLLSSCDIVVSTAIQENFGIGVIEAIFAGCHPILPRRLAYPEIIPMQFHDACLYDSDSCLLGRLRDVVARRGLMVPSQCARLRDALRSEYGALTAVTRLDAALQRLTIAKPA